MELYRDPVARFAVERHLGSGGMGVVYEAFDRERGATVAVKTLARMDPASIYRFKQEFRALANLSHPNLVELHELVSIDGRWFLTMEVIDGSDFLAHVRPGAVDCARLRRALAQLADGLNALHDAGKLHRDIKPTNVMVTPEGRVVLLDFGLVQEQTNELGASSLESQLVGTPAYMSPEHALGETLGPASDWYSVGAIIYEALTGERPHSDGSGNPIRVMLKKQVADPIPPGDLVEGLPADLCELCMDLLRRDPALRPGGRDVVARLGCGDAPTDSGRVRERSGQPFVGRAGALRSLRDAFEAARGSHAATVHVTGRSGMGKSALVRQFLLELRARQDVVVLQGRCYERESVPYKALDSLVDALSRHLRRMSRAEADELMPRHVHTLARLFPSLQRVEAVAAAPRREEIRDAHELRRRGFAALKELLARMADRRPLVLHIDDLQWGDLDSATLLAELIGPPDPPGMLLIVSFRSEDIESSPCLRTLLAPAAPGIAGVRTVEVGPLELHEAEALAATLIAGGAPERRSIEQARKIAREAEGNPLFVGELVRAAEGGRGVTVEEALRTRIAGLPDAARHMLEIVALAGGPIEQHIAVRAIEPRAEAHAALALLRAQNLVRTSGPRERDPVEPFHDRVREAMIASLGAGRKKAYHTRLAALLEAAGGADPEVLAVHLHGAGQLERASDYAAAAATHAAEALAFDRASRLFRLAREWKRGDAAHRRDLDTRLADSLASAGRGAEAADAYLRAAEGAPAELDLRRRAAEQLGVSGHTDRALAVMPDVLAGVGMHLPKTRWGAVGSLVFGRVRVRLGGLRFRQRDASEVPPELLQRIDTCWTVAAGLGYADAVHTADFATRHLLLALRSGEPTRVARGLAFEAIYASAAGSSGLRRAAGIADTLRELAERIDQPYVLGLASFAAGAVEYQAAGRWRRALDFFEAAEGMVRGRCAGVAWELVATQWLSAWSLFNLGELAELSRRLPGLFRTAQERGDLHAQVLLGTLANVTALAAGDIEEARRQVLEAMGGREARGAQSVNVLLADARNDLYAGRGRVASERVEAAWPSLERTLFLRVQNVRLVALQERAKCALAAAASGHERVANLRAAERHARAIERERMAWALPTVHLVRAGCALLGGDDRLAVSLLSAAAKEFDSAEMALHAAAARRRLGEVLGAGEGAELVAGADAAMTAQGIRDPERWTAMIAPGF